MKKIDLHIHTLYTVSDSKKFDFSLNSLRNYVENRKLDVVAITNHNRFDKRQFEEIANDLSIDVFPGVEVDLEHAHLLVIGDNDQDSIADFDKKCLEFNKYIFTQNDSLSIEQFYSIFPKESLNRYILIPHYDKKPSLPEKVIAELNNYIPICSGEVSNAKKFIQAINNPDRLSPVLFSDSRMFPDLNKFSNQQTFLDIEDISLNAIKYALSDKNKIFLSQEDGHELFNVTDTFKASTGLNILIGERSSGKTYTLNELFNNYENIKYIKQFELVEQNPENSEESFKKKLSEDESVFSRDYLLNFSGILDQICQIDNLSRDHSLNKYRDSLINHAENIDKQDNFSKTIMFQEIQFPLQNLENLEKLITSTSNIIENVEYRDIIDHYIPKVQLRKLIVQLIIKYRRLTLDNNFKKITNELIQGIQRELQLQTSIPKIEEIDLITIAKDIVMIQKFNLLVEEIKKDKIIKSDPLYDFTIEARRKIYTGSGELKRISKTKSGFSQAYSKYDNPFEFLQELKQITTIQEIDYYKYFCNIEFKILNRFGLAVSGGERAEFNFIRKIEDALQYELLLIDEPESSFDNIFLNKRINVQLKDISKKIPVFISTHNNTIGASIRPDYIIYTRKIIEDNQVSFKTYTGFPTDKVLKSLDGNVIDNLAVQLDCLEAGKDSYDERKQNYEILTY